MIEPTPHYLHAGADVLTRGGYEVISASTVEDAVLLTARFDPHLILLDGALAHAHVLDELSRSSVRPLSIIFTFMQGRGSQLMTRIGTSAEEANVEVIGFVEKPFAPDILLTTVDEGVRAAEDAADRPLIDTQRILAREDETQVSRIETPGSLYRALGLEISREIVREGGFDSRTLEPELPDLPDRAPSIRANAMTRAHQLAERICSMMPERYPLHPAQMCAVASACEEALREEKTTPTAREANIVAEGSLAGVPPFQVLQLAENLGGTVMCRFKNNGVVVDVWLAERHVVWAQDRNRFEDTEQLVYDVLSWSEGRFSVASNVTLPPIGAHANVSMPLAALLLEGLSRLDQWRRDQFSHPPQ